MTRTTLRTCLALLTAVGIYGCGPDPEPQTPANPPSGTTAPAPTTTAATPPPTEPTAEQRKATAKAAIDAKDWAKAKAELSAVVAKNPNDVEAHKMMGQVAEAQNDAAGATESYYQAAKADGGKDEVLAMAAALGLYGQRRYDDLVGLMQMATKANDKSMPLWMYLGLGQIAKEDWAGAESTYAKLTSTFGDEPQLWAQLAVVQASAGKNDDAKKSAKTALDKWTEARNPKSTKDIKLGKGAEEIALIARAYRRAGDPKGAEAALGKYTVPKDETAPLLDVERGLAKVAAKDAKAAAPLADKAAKAGGDNFAPAHLLQAAIAAWNKKPDEAKTHLSNFEKTARRPADWAWERKWIDGMLAPAAMQPLKPAGGDKQPKK